MTNSGNGYYIPRENEFQSMNSWIPATPNNVNSSIGNSIPIQLLGSNLETPNWQQMLNSTNDHPSVSGLFQPLQDLDPYQQHGRTGSQIYGPDSFMALLGADGSYGLDSSLLYDDGGFNKVCQDYPITHASISQGIDTLGSNCAVMDPPWMASQFVAQSSSLPPQFAPQNRTFHPSNRPVIPNLNVQASVDWIGSHSATIPLVEQNHGLVSTTCNASKDVFQIPEDQFLVPNVQLEFNLNSPARTETEASFSQTLEFWGQTSAAKLQLSESDGRLLGGDKQQIKLAENCMPQRNNELRQVVADASTFIIPAIEKIMGNDEGAQVIDLNKTPQHKTPKRRKHRPKVIREGKPKKTPKSETPKNPKNSEKPKRKYTRKSSLKASEIQPTGDSTKEPVAKSCRRTLSFERQKTAEQTENKSISQLDMVHQASRVGFNLNSENQATERFCDDINIFQRESVVQMVGQDDFLPLIHPAHLKKNLAHSMPRGSTINNPHSLRPHPTRTTTFQDLLSGNGNNCCSMITPRKPNLSLNSHAHAMYPTEAMMAESQSALQHRQAELHKLNQHTRTMGNFHNLNSQQTVNIISHAMRHPPTQTTTFQELHKENENRAQNTASSTIIHGNHNTWRNCYNPVQKFTSAENTRQQPLQANNTHDNLVRCGQMTLCKSTQPLMVISDSIQSEARISKRDRNFISDQHPYHSLASINFAHSSRVMEDGFKSRHAPPLELSEADKKRRTENMLYMEMSSAHNRSFADINSEQLQTNKGSNTHVYRGSSHFNPYPWMSYSTDISQSAEFSRVERVGYGLPTSSTAFNHSSKQRLSSEQHSYISSLQKTGKFANVQVSPLLPPTSEHNLHPVPAKALLLDSQETAENNNGVLNAKQYSRPTASGLLLKTTREALSGDRQAVTTTMTNGPSKNIDARSSVSSRKKGNDHRPPSSRKRGLLRKKDIKDLIDEIVCQMERLKLDNASEDVMVQPENAIIPYQADGPIVMYQAKKRKPRPKVDLDPESNRIWKLLMGKEAPMEGTDTDKEKWWEEERTLFRLRADSFIARMHLVQGDRRFSKWKGSVVDSVIGVFLTQNVSDHLSSSAFMSLAARFPLSLRRASCTEDEVLNKEEPEFCIIDLGDSIPNNDTKQALSCGNSAVENEGKVRISGTEIVNSADNCIKGANNETLSLDSLDSSTCLTNRGSSSGSNSEVEEQLFTHILSVYKANKPTEVTQLSSRDSPLEIPVCSFHHPEDAQQPTFPSCDSQQHLQLNSIQGAPEKDCERFSGGESMSPCFACDASECSSNTSDLELQTRSNLRQNRESGEKTEPRPDLNELGSYAVQQEVILTIKPSKEAGQHPCSDHHHESLNFHSDQASAIEEVTEPILKEPGLSNAANISNKGNSPNKKRGKQETDKKLVDWDKLRKEAQGNNRRWRNKDAMDSMDYETMRHADVKEISNAIKERGMNNMLAERIKDFLNRLVTDHGSIDLEWLRDAPPDKAKDYLLSIRGLGLKSVECVRLLTLHHLAFPVDTNVGRIAVRLGWVPLQPLPESLQLHLLEMYPVLETIQKYLWPRLCKLDQRTLYELHYQLITFGKVFCTKSKPNCNACPMRAECRHFASAFASARLALPGPEEKNIVPSRVSVSSDKSPATDTPSRSLLEWDSGLLGVEKLTKSKCEPIVEEPTTPEQEPEEVIELDIEDSFGEDPDEIPTIRLDFQEFTQNLQSYMQKNNLDIQEDDMSKALVALTAETASLPPQKLKNVSRLRTEHQVYELPDSHPLLKEMDKREADDPSPYLLAIWTPGETAISTQPPESQCQSDDSSNMCNEKTCFSCNSRREADSNIVRGTLLIPCRTAMRGSFPLNGTYFQVNEMFADHESSMNPIDVPREWIWNLPRRTVYFGTSVSSIFKGLSTEGIQYCFWRGFVCVRGFDQKYRAPRPLLARLHHPASKQVMKSKEENK